MTFSTSLFTLAASDCARHLQNCRSRLDRLRFALLLAALLGSVLSSRSAQAQTTGALSSVLRDMTGQSWTDVQAKARWQANSDGPNYSNAPSTTPSYASFEGDYTPPVGSGSTTRLAIFSDDGCDVFLNGSKIHSRRGRGQALPDLSQSLYPLGVTLNGGQTYRIRIEYSNASYSGTTDIDGATLFAYSEGTLPLKVTVSATSDHLEANGEDKSNVSVLVTYLDGSPRVNQAVTLGSSYGSLKDTAMITDSAGNATVDTNGNGMADTNEPRSTTLTASTSGVLARVTAVASGNTAFKNVLFHKVDVTGNPRLLVYYPDSQQSAQRNPQISFNVSQAPAVAQMFKVTITIYTLKGHDAIAQKTDYRASGQNTASWSDFFYNEGEAANGREPNLGEGIYPYQIDVEMSQVDAAYLTANGINDQSCTHGNWKASKSLVIDWTYDRVFYSETQDKTMVNYIFQMQNLKSNNAPQNVTIDVYDPDYNIVKTVSVNVQGTATAGKFIGAADFPLPDEGPGTYHFVVEAQQADAAAEGKDRSKWALEQNGSAKIPTFAVFGGQEPGVTQISSNSDCIVSNDR